MKFDWFGEDVNDDPFIADHVWSWPDDAGRREFDFHDDDDVEYAFVPEDDVELLHRGYRLKIRNWTYVVLVFKTDDDGPFGDGCNGAETTELVYLNDEQIGGFTREYQLVEADDGGLNVDVDITPYGKWPDVIWTATHDVNRDFASFENVIDVYVENSVQ